MIEKYGLGEVSSPDSRDFGILHLQSAVCSEGEVGSSQWAVCSEEEEKKNFKLQAGN